MSLVTTSQSVHFPPTKGGSTLGGVYTKSTPDEPICPLSTTSYCCTVTVVHRLTRDMMLPHHFFCIFICQQVEPPQQQVTQSPSLQPQNSWDTPFAMENYVLRGVGPEGRTRSNSTVSAGSMGGLMTLDGLPMATKVCSCVLSCHHESPSFVLDTRNHVVSLLFVRTLRC